MLTEKNPFSERIEKAVGSIGIPAGRRILYHGSKYGIQGKIAPVSRKQCDFGPGFYMGTDPEQALTLICDYDDSVFYIVSVDMQDLSCLEIPADLEWAMTVAYHRGRMEAIKGTEFYNRMKNRTAGKDMIVGNIANDRMFYVIDNFFLGNITDKALVHSLSALRLGKQFVAVTEKGCDAVRIEAELPLSSQERIYLQAIAEQKREKGISAANEICRNYRREGLFFDELLKNYAEGKIDG